MVRNSACSLSLVVSAIFGVLAIGWSVTLTSAVQLLAITVLTMGGTNHPLVTPDGAYAESPDFVDGYVNDAIITYVATTGSLRGQPTDAGEYDGVAVYSPEEFFPVYGSMTFDDSVDVGVANLDACVNGQNSCGSRDIIGTPQAGAPIVVFGYSQSARVATIEKRALAEQYPDGVGAPDVSFVLIGNPNRPNGGILERFEGLHIPIMGVTFDGATPTDTPFATVDITRQYDGWADFPLYPLNMLATMNAIAGIYYLHGDYFGPNVEQALEQGQYGDTTYYLIPSPRLPLLLPLEQAGVPSPILTALDAPLRVIVEWGYDRDPEHLGTPMHARIIPLTNPVTGLHNLAVAIPTGLDDGLAEAADDPQFRPLGTTPATSPYGVGGQPVGAPIGTDPAAEEPEPESTPAAPPVTEQRRVTTTAVEDDEQEQTEVTPRRRGPVHRFLDHLKPQRKESEEQTGTGPGAAATDDENADDKPSGAEGHQDADSARGSDPAAA